ncbi:MAG: hypothetical protein HY817_02530 [Candidatus Abawacabacteria bacterium]|nr:hypothetical protein [Candidatus Abawacabacteria bacterium]
MKEVNCRITGTPFQILPLEEQLLDKISPVINGRKFALPLPTICPQERLRNRLAFRNDRNLYRRKCALTGNDILSVYHPEKSFPVYSMTAWWSDQWDPLAYGRDFDFSRPFFEQFAELMQAVPRLAMINKNPNNSDYIAIGSDNRNCYLCSPSTANEDCMYGGVLYHSKNVVDGYMSLANEVSYDTIHCDHCYRSFFSKDCGHCSDIYFCEDCSGCQSCFGCFGLRSKSYCWFNEQLTKEEFEQRLTEFKGHLSRQKIEEIKKQFADFAKLLPHRPLYLRNAESCLGDYLVDCKNCLYCFDLEEAQDCVYVTRFARGIVDSVDSCEGADGVELCFNVMSAGLKLYHAICTTFVWGSRDVIYCDHCFNVEDCFGCIGLRNHARYCIFNKQYTKEVYEELVPKIIEHMQKTGEWGLFFPAHLAPFSYNETIASVAYPLSKEEALKKGMNWSDYQAPLPQVPAVAVATLPAIIADVSDSILDQAILCKETEKPFRIIRQELDFYRANNIPLPDSHPDIRHLHRVHARNAKIFYKRNCPKDGKEFYTTYKPDNNANIYCEQCYLAEHS